MCLGSRLLAGEGVHVLAGAVCGPASGGAMNAPWRPGQNFPLVHRGRRGEICPKLRMAVANILWNLRASALCNEICYALSAPGDATQATSACHAVACLTGLLPKTVFEIETDMIRLGWAWGGETFCKHTSAKELRRPQAIEPTSASGDLASRLPPLAQATRAPGGEHGASLPQPSNSAWLPILPVVEPQEADTSPDEFVHADA